MRDERTAWGLACLVQRWWASHLDRLEECTWEEVLVVVGVGTKGMEECSWKITEANSWLPGQRLKGSTPKGAVCTLVELCVSVHSWAGGVRRRG